MDQTAKPELPLSLIQQTQKALDSPTCICGATKRVGQSFCLKCFFALPGPMRFCLHKMFSEGLAVYWKDAAEWLTLNHIPTAKK